MGISIVRLNRNKAYIQICLDAWIYNEVLRASGPAPAQHLIPETAEERELRHNEQMQREAEAEMLIV